MRDWSNIAEMEEYARSTWGETVAKQNEEIRILKQKLNMYEQVIERNEAVHNHWTSFRSALQENPGAEDLWKQCLILLRLSEPS